MSFSLSQLFGQRGAPRSVRPAVPAAAAEPAESPLGPRREKLRLALRDTLRRCGFDGDWVTADVLVGASRTQDMRLHVRLVLRHWDAALVLHSMALQEEVRRRLLTLDAQSAQWVASFSWQFALPQDAEYPPLPDRQRPLVSAVAAAKPPQDTRAQLDRMFDDADSAAGPADHAFASTEPAGLH